jgi:mannosyl-3-phosphoglycerate phosphatase
MQTQRGSAGLESRRNKNLEMEMDIQLMFFTDLDGTLLDQETYSFEPALPALKILKEKDIPLIICTSKTRAEIEKIRSLLQNTDPFISENGGAIFIPKQYFSHQFPFGREESGYFIIELGTPYKELRKVFNHMRAHSPDKLRGFADLTAKEVADLCGFSMEEARLAKKREYDEPFILDDKSMEEGIKKIAQRSNLHITRGGRFFHLIGGNDKGKAVLKLINVYREKIKHIQTIALGDSLNDLPMLKAVDYPILVQKPDGSYDPSVKLDNLILAPGRGPAGWYDAVLKILNKLS